jgi:[ribosomal protein S5]-alanine N-acetyltransferase
MMDSQAMLASPRLSYEPLRIHQLDRFHSLVEDAHVRRYLMDGEVFPREWSEARIRDSEALMSQRGVGLWLAFDTASGALAGFCGFLVMPSVHQAPQLVYALFEPFTGKGYATEMARASIADARANAGFTDIVAAVDGVNVASVRVLEKLGFVRQGTTAGAFGDTFVYLLSL